MVGVGDQVTWGQLDPVESFDVLRENRFTADAIGHVVPGEARYAASCSYLHKGDARKTPLDIHDSLQPGR
jgi:hypothetical protein